MTSTAYTYLNIPDLTAFKAFLKENHIREFAIVDRRTGRDIFVDFFIRLTAKLPERQEIAVCDLRYWHGIFYDDILPDINKSKKDKVAEIKQALADLKQIDGEYTKETAQ